MALAEAGCLGDSEDEQKLYEKLTWQRWQIEGVIDAREVLEAGLDGIRRGRPAGLDRPDQASPCTHASVCRRAVPHRLTFQKGRRGVPGSL